MTPEEIKKVREQLGTALILQELHRMRALLRRAQHPSKDPLDEYEDLAVFDDDDDDQGEE